MSEGQEITDKQILKMIFNKDSLALADTNFHSLTRNLVLPMLFNLRVTLALALASYIRVCTTIA